MLKISLHKEGTVMLQLTVSQSFCREILSDWEWHNRRLCQNSSLQHSACFIAVEYLMNTSLKFVMDSCEAGDLHGQKRKVQ